MQILDLIVVSSLVILAISLLLLTLALIPVVLQLSRTLSLINSISFSLKQELLPSLLEFNGLFRGVNQTLKKSQTFKAQLVQKFSLYKETAKRYLANLKKTEKQNEK